MPVTLRIRQYVYFSVSSSAVSADEMATAIGLPADEVSVLGSRRAEPPVPRQHAWSVRCAEPGLRVDEQLDLLVERLQPYRDAIRGLVDELESREGTDAGASLHVVRYLDDRDGPPDGWQHRLLGWHLGQDVLRFAVEVRADLDVDEYGQDLPWFSRQPTILDRLPLALRRRRGRARVGGGKVRRRA